MTKALELHDIAALDRALEGSAEVPVLLFKHSATCDISAAAWNSFQDFLQENELPLAVYFVVVQTARTVSNTIEQRFDILHESPQAILFVQGKPVWNASHRRLMTKVFHDAVKTHTVQAA
jgi:bacillithiol system protein YtxJ